MRTVVIALGAFVMVSSGASARGHHHMPRHHGHGHVHVHNTRTGPGIPGPVRTALNQVSSQCQGFRIVSHFRPGAHVAGTRRVSLHASGRAVDFRVSNWGCAYHALRGWGGGISMDAPRVHHIHISYGGHEGHFMHHMVGSVRYASRHMRYRHHRRYA